jgi:hypothetical protein
MSYIDLCAAGRVQESSSDDEPAIDMKSPGGKSERKPKMTLKEAKDGMLTYAKIIAEKPRKELVAEYFKQRIAKAIDESDEDDEDQEDYVDEKPKKKSKK